MAFTLSIVAEPETEGKVVQAGQKTRSWIQLLTAQGAGEYEVSREGGSVRIAVDTNGLARLVMK